MSFSPRLLVADNRGRIYDESRLLMTCERAGEIVVPEPSELVPLPRESELFLLPGRKAVGFNPRRRQLETVNALAVAAFAAPGFTLSAHPAYKADADAPVLPLFAYGAVGYAKGGLWICARKVDEDKRQVFTGIKPALIEKNCRELLRENPHNRLVNHIINNCVRRYACPAARNFALGRYEAPLPTSRSCNAHCLGCISALQKESPLVATPQCRLGFTPSSGEIAEVMAIHSQRERERPVFSFGQGCEGDPLMNPELLAESIGIFRSRGGKGTINCNTNASKPEAVRMLVDAGLTSMRVSLNSAQPHIYEAYYRPGDYSFSDVLASIAAARKGEIFVSLNLLFFPGITDTDKELEALAELCKNYGVSMIQWRNLNIDPGWYSTFMNRETGNQGKAMGLEKFMQRLKNDCPWLRYGYFNPWLGEKAHITAPMPQ